MYWICAIVIVYLLIAVGFYFFQHFAFFRPEILPDNFQYKYEFPFEELHFTMEDGAVVNGIYFEVPNSLGVIYYLKGNSKSIKGWGKFAKDFVGKGYDFFMMDYRGFGKSKGRRTEEILYSDAQQMYKWLLKKYKEENIVVMGRSFGSGIAARIASWNHPKMLILDSPYYSFKRLITRFGGFLIPMNLLMRYKVPTNQYLKKVECPIYIIHGTKDRLVKFKDGMELVEENKDRAEMIAIEGAGHNNLPKFPKFHNELYRILTEG